ncbi:MAG: hypothetical protein ACT4NV_14185 [Rhodoferax sp.]
MKFHLGQKVTWSSQANGSATEKTGIVEVIKAPMEWLSQDQRIETDSYGRPRAVESYLVRVPGKTARSKGKLYWPLTQKLRAAK